MIKALTVAQLGDVPVRLYNEDYAGYGVSFDVDTVRFAKSRRIHFGDRSRNPKELKMKLKGSILASNYRSIDQQFVELTSIGGGEIDVIAYTFFDCCGDVNCCGTCGNIHNTDLLWLHTRGVIEDLDLDEKDQNGQISITLSCRPDWQPVNRLLWHYGGMKDAPRKRYSLSSPVMRDLGRLPTAAGTFTAEKACMGSIFNKRRYDDDLVMFNPEVWDALHRYLRPTYSQTGYGHGWRTMALENPALSRFQISDSVHVDPTRWSAEPSSLYAFRGLNAGATLTISVERRIRNSVFDYNERITTVDLQTTHQSLIDAALGGLLPTDILIIGDVEALPGMIIRSNAVLEGVFPEVSYSDDHPGELGVGSNYLDILATSQNTVECARLHTFRRL